MPNALADAPACFSVTCNKKTLLGLAKSKNVWIECVKWRRVRITYSYNIDCWIEA